AWVGGGRAWAGSGRGGLCYRPGPPVSSSRLSGHLARVRPGREPGAILPPESEAMRHLRIALGQINATVGDLQGNTRRVLETIEQARPLGVDLVAFPELVLTGYPPEDLLFKPAFIEANLRALDEVV